MGNIFKYDSPFMTKLAMVFNLALLNLLWLITSLPIVTMGAANTAVYAVLFRHLTDEGDDIIKPYFKAFASNFKQSTCVWLPMLAVIVILVIDAYYVLTHPDVTWLLWIPFAVVLLVLLALTTYVFGLIARFENTLRDTMRNSFLLFMLNLIPSVSMVLVSAVPLLMYLFATELFFRIGLLWLLYGMSLFAYVNAYTMLRVFKRHMPKEESEETAGKAEV